MSPFSRRQTLGATAVLLAGSSGCTSAARQDTPTDTATESERTFAHCVRDPTTRQVRHPEGTPAIRSSAFTPAGDWSSVGWVVTSPDERDALEYSSDATGLDAATAFVDGTDLDEQHVLVHQHRFDECLTLRLKRLKWTASDYPTEGAYDVGVEYADSERDESCGRRDSDYTIATVTRVPAEIEAIGRFTWGTMQIGQRSC